MGCGGRLRPPLRHCPVTGTFIKKSAYLSVLKMVAAHRCHLSKGGKIDGKIPSLLAQVEPGAASALQALSSLLKNLFTSLSILKR
jgi:hypothetical protein